jgi:predicted 2-oxoglutarate/Fe(II)-dependent dioxygenase YbiX
MISFNIALNENFEGGGTSHPAVDEPVRIGTGDVLMHSGKVLHSGNNVTSGIRYIIVAFVWVDSPRINYEFIQAKARVGISNDDLFRNILRY